MPMKRQLTPWSNNYRARNINQLRHNIPRQKFRGRLPPPPPISHPRNLDLMTAAQTLYDLTPHHIPVAQRNRFQYNNNSPRLREQTTTPLVFPSFYHHRAEHNEGKNPRVTHSRSIFGHNQHLSQVRFEPFREQSGTQIGQSGSHTSGVNKSPFHQFRPSALDMGADNKNIFSSNNNNNIPRTPQKPKDQLVYIYEDDEEEYEDEEPEKIKSQQPQIIQNIARQNEPQSERFLPSHAAQPPFHPFFNSNLPNHEIKMPPKRPEIVTTKPYVEIVPSSERRPPSDYEKVRFPGQRFVTRNNEELDPRTPNTRSEVEKSRNLRPFIIQNINPQNAYTPITPIRQLQGDKNEEHNMRSRFEEFERPNPNNAVTRRPNTEQNEIQNTRTSFQELERQNFDAATRRPISGQNEIQNIRTSFEELERQKFHIPATRRPLGGQNEEQNTRDSFENFHMPNFKSHITPQRRPENIHNEQQNTRTSFEDFQAPSFETTTRGFQRQISNPITEAPVINHRRPHIPIPPQQNSPNPFSQGSSFESNGFIRPHRPHLGAHILNDDRNEKSVTQNPNLQIPSFKPQTTEEINLNDLKKLEKPRLRPVNTIVPPNRVPTNDVLPPHFDTNRDFFNQHDTIRDFNNNVDQDQSNIGRIRSHQRGDILRGRQKSPHTQSHRNSRIPETLEAYDYYQYDDDEEISSQRPTKRPRIQSTRGPSTTVATTTTTTTTRRPRPKLRRPNFPISKPRIVITTSTTTTTTEKPIETTTVQQILKTTGKPLYRLGNLGNKTGGLYAGKNIPILLSYGSPVNFNSLPEQEINDSKLSFYHE